MTWWHPSKIQMKLAVTSFSHLSTPFPRSVQAPQREVEDPLGCRQVGLFSRSSGFEELLCRFHGGLFLQDLWLPHRPWSSAGEARCCTPAAAGWSYVLRRCGWESGRGSIRPWVSRVVDSFKMPSKMIKSVSNHRLIPVFLGWIQISIAQPYQAHSSSMAHPGTPQQLLQYQVALYCQSLPDQVSWCPSHPCRSGWSEALRTSKAFSLCQHRSEVSKQGGNLHLCSFQHHLHRYLQILKTHSQSVRCSIIYIYVYIYIYISMSSSFTPKLHHPPQLHRCTPGLRDVAFGQPLDPAASPPGRVPRSLPADGRGTARQWPAAQPRRGGARAPRVGDDAGPHAGAVAVPWGQSGSPMGLGGVFYKGVPWNPQGSRRVEAYCIGEDSLTWQFSNMSN